MTNLPLWIPLTAAVWLALMVVTGRRFLRERRALIANTPVVGALCRTKAQRHGLAAAASEATPWARGWRR